MDMKMKGTIFVKNVFGVYLASVNMAHHGFSGVKSPRSHQGAIQMLFCDVTHFNLHHWNTYEEDLVCHKQLCNRLWTIYLM